MVANWRFDLCIAALPVFLAAGAIDAAETVWESPRRIPVVADADVVVVGGTSAGVVAAQAAASKGARVFLVAPRAYLGEDMAGTRRTWIEEDETPTTSLAKKIFEKSRHVTPAYVKATFDEALLSAGVHFLTHSFATDLLYDASGWLGGVVIANRSGRQAITAKVIVDATERAVVARMAGAKFSPYPAGPQRFLQVVIGGPELRTPGLTARKLPGQFETALSEKGKAAQMAGVVEYSIEIPMADGSWASFAEAEQIARDKTFDPAQLDASDTLFHVPPDTVQSEEPWKSEWPGASQVGLKAFRPAGVPRIWVLGGCTDMPRTAAAQMLRPAAFMEVGERIGAAAAEEAGAIGALEGVRLPGHAGAPARPADDIREFLDGIRAIPQDGPTVPAEARAVPVLGRYDVVVIGGGTGGAPAGIGAGRSKARTLIVEFLHGLGGVGTQGMIGRYYHGNKVGFTAEHDAGVKEMNPAVHVIGKAEWWRRENRKADTTLWFGAMGCGAYVGKDAVKGVVVATPQGRGVVLARTVIDATGNADIAVAAGALHDYIGSDEVAVQGAGLSPRPLGSSSSNTDYTFSDDCDTLDAWQFHIYARKKFKTSYDIAQIVNTRERRRIVGDYTLTPMDILLQRTFPDTIVMAKSEFDSHGFTVHSLFLLAPPDRKELWANLPFRCLLPKGIENILVTGLGISAHRDAMPVVRMQPDVQNQGYAAGVAAAMAAQAGVPVRQINVQALQKHLVEKKNLPAGILGAKDSLPFPAEKIAAAVQTAGNGYQGIEVILAHAETALPMLRRAWAGAQGEAKTAYAHILGMLGDAAGASTLAEAVRGAAWDKGWNFKGMYQVGASCSQLDSRIIALGRTRNPAAIEPILAKARELDDEKKFSHHRAVALALETLRNPAAAPVLAEVLAKPGMSGHAVTRMPGADAGKSGETIENRNAALREIYLARALFRCGDKDGFGRKILEEYARDLRGPFARHAAAVLKEKIP